MKLGPLCLIAREKRRTGSSAGRVENEAAAAFAVRSYEGTSNHPNRHLCTPCISGGRVIVEKSRDQALLQFEHGVQTAGYQRAAGTMASNRY